MNAGELTERQAFLVLNALPNIGPITLTRLLAELGDDPRAVFAAGAQRLEEVRGVGPAISGTIAGWAEHFDLAREEERMAQADTDFVTQRDGYYPRLLREIDSAPIGLYRKGPYDFSQPSVAIVGSRRTTLYGQSVAKKLGADLARMGFCVVSGLARGIDTAAHEGALSVGGKTAAVLGNGIDIIYPAENLNLYRQIAETGAVLSEFPFTRRADKQSFAMRNRIVAGICDAVVVVESDVAGGSMITARFAGEQGRLIFAVPGRIDQATSAGCHQLIRDGATLLTGVDDILSELNYLDGLRPSAIPEKTTGGTALAASNLTAEEQKVYACFSGGAMVSIDAITGQTGLPTSQLSATLMMLELKRLIVKRADGTFEAR
ncbi:DNA-processing protein DprA [Rariglobus hedericola]|uniref:DNA-protecting protein DprA n=1 Tax=Rariglobus hedericola TaxID=2597822 RepID=A0A556QKV5_9BACT|nr:DNA-processing protein DprA [Rariglobus hedericola]TSJ77280.1 DNA-protecting protein DprA [Rariglobus hedericola]